MDGQLDGIFLAGSLPHEFIILIVTLFICLWLINFFFSLPLSEKLNIVSCSACVDDVTSCQYSMLHICLACVSGLFYFRPHRIAR